MSEQDTANVTDAPSVSETAKSPDVSSDPKVSTSAVELDNSDAPMEGMDNGKGKATEPEGMDKGKGKATEPDTTQDLSMDDADSSSDDEDPEVVNPIEDPDEENLKEIDPQNIIGDGRRTRGRRLDFSNVVEDEDDYNEDEDDDFVVPEDDEMKD